MSSADSSDGAPPVERAAHDAWLVSLTRLPDGGTAADLGCGTGHDLALLAARHTHAANRFVGVDIADQAEAGVAAVASSDARISYRRASLDDRLPFEDASLDLVFSHNLVECLPDARAFALEVARVLRPGGQAVIAHWDWDSQLFDGSDKAAIRRLVSAYADWQQAWMEHADGWMGRRLWGAFQPTDAFDGAMHARVLIETVYDASRFGYQNATALGGLVRRGLASPAEYERFRHEQVELHERGRYFYSITGFAYVGLRRDTA